MGFSWDNSYDDWMNVFKILRFEISVTHKPSQSEYNGQYSLNASFIAISSDRLLSFELDFDYGNNGCYTSSPKTLDVMYVRYNRKLSGVESMHSVINDFFPIFGVTLGKTTWKQVESMGYEVEIVKGGPGRHVDIESISFWDHEGVGVFTSLYWQNSYNKHDFPLLWKSKGFSWDNSYDEWIEVFRKLGFNITVVQQPNQKEFLGRISFSAKFKALSPDGILLFTMEFGYGKNGYYTSSPKTLYSITVTDNG